MDRSDLKEELKSISVNKELPFGSYYGLAKKYSLDRRNVFTMSRRLGLAVESRPVKQKPVYECICGKISTSENLCRQCLKITLKCFSCSKIFERPISHILRNIRRNNTNSFLNYSNSKFFCSRKCLGINWKMHRNGTNESHKE